MHKLISSILLTAFVTAFENQAQVVLEIETATKVQFNAKSDKSYQVYATTNVDKTGWSALGAPQIGPEGLITFFHTTTGDQKVFFKVEEIEGGSTTPGRGTPQVLIERARLSLNGQDLSGLILTNADLNNFSFANAILNHTDLSGSKLANATISGANFTNAILVGTDFTGVSGTGVRFWGADLRNARLPAVDGDYHNANLSGAIIASPFQFAADFTGAIGTNMIATNQSLVFRSTQGANLSGSDFSGSSFGFSSFAGANLTGAKFVNVTFNYSPPSGSVSFDNADLTEADLTGATNFITGHGTIFKNTRMPDGTLRTGIGQDPSSLVGKTLSFNYTAGGSEKFTFVTETSGNYNGFADPFTYSFDRSSGKLHIQHQNVSYDVTLDLTHSSGHLTVLYTPSGAQPIDEPADYTLL